MALLCFGAFGLQIWREANSAKPHIVSLPQRQHSPCELGFIHQHGSIMIAINHRPVIDETMIYLRVLPT